MNDEQLGTLARVKGRAGPSDEDDSLEIVIIDDPIEVTTRPETRSGVLRTFALASTMVLPAALYLLYVWHYSLNIPFADDWRKAPFVASGLHGHLSLTAMWSQYAEARLFVPNLVFVGVGMLDHFNLKALIGLSALTFVASYFLLLALSRTYLARPLTPLRVLSLGIIWFSLADTGNSLWAFQIAWYLVVFFLALMLFCLLAWPQARGWGIAVAIFAAVAGSLSMLQGFALWPVGLICLLWTWERRRGQVIALMSWIGAAGLTGAAYLYRYRLTQGCTARANCSIADVAHRPAHFARFFSFLLGYVVPTMGPFGRQYFGLHQLLGVLIAIATIVAIVGSLRERRSSPRPPLALALIVFALLFDLTIVVGRGAGRVAAASQSRFTMPNIVLVFGLALYAWAHLANLRVARASPGTRRRLGMAAFAATTAFVLAFGIFTTHTGIVEGRSWHRVEVTEARVLVNRNSIPPPQVRCYISIFVTNGFSRARTDIDAFWYLYVRTMQREHMYVFEASAFRKYRAEGPPVVRGVCTFTSATQLVPRRGGR